MSGFFFVFFLFSYPSAQHKIYKFWKKKKLDVFKVLNKNIKYFQSSILFFFRKESGKSFDISGFNQKRIENLTNILYKENLNFFFLFSFWCGLYYIISLPPSAWPSSSIKGNKKKLWITKEKKEKKTYEILRESSTKIFLYHFLFAIVFLGPWAFVQVTKCVRVCVCVFSYNGF